MVGEVVTGLFSFNSDDDIDQTFKAMQSTSRATAVVNAERAFVSPVHRGSREAELHEHGCDCAKLRLELANGGDSHEFEIT